MEKIKIIREFKKRVVLAGKPVVQTWVEFECPNCGKRKESYKSVVHRTATGAFCSTKCRQSFDNPNGNWWEDAYTTMVRELDSDAPSKISGHGGRFRTRDIDAGSNYQRDYAHMMANAKKAAR